MIYRVHMYSETLGSSGFRYFGSKREAAKAAAEFRSYDKHHKPSIEAAPMPKNKLDVLCLLIRWADHPDNG